MSSAIPSSLVPSDLILGHVTDNNGNVDQSDPLPLNSHTMIEAIPNGSTNLTGHLRAGTPIAQGVIPAKIIAKANQNARTSFYGEGGIFPTSCRNNQSERRKNVTKINVSSRLDVILNNDLFKKHLRPDVLDKLSSQHNSEPGGRHRVLKKAHSNFDLTNIDLEEEFEPAINDPHLMCSKSESRQPSSAPKIPPRRHKSLIDSKDLEELKNVLAEREENDLTKTGHLHESLISHRNRRNKFKVPSFEEFKKGSKSRVVSGHIFAKSVSAEYEQTVSSSKGQQKTRHLSHLQDVDIISEEEEKESHGKHIENESKTLVCEDIESESNNIHEKYLENESESRPVPEEDFNISLQTDEEIIKLYLGQDSTQSGAPNLHSIHEEGASREPQGQETSNKPNIESSPERERFGQSQGHYHNQNGNRNNNLNQTGKPPQVVCLQKESLKHQGVKNAWNVTNDSDAAGDGKKKSLAQVEQVKINICGSEKTSPSTGKSQTATNQYNHSSFLERDKGSELSLSSSSSSSSLGETTLVEEFSLLSLDDDVSPTRTDSCRALTNGTNGENGLGGLCVSERPKPKPRKSRRDSGLLPEIVPKFAAEIEESLMTLENTEEESVDCDLRVCDDKNVHKHENKEVSFSEQLNFQPQVLESMVTGSNFASGDSSDHTDVQAPVNFKVSANNAFNTSSSDTDVFLDVSSEMENISSSTPVDNIRDLSVSIKAPNKNPPPPEFPTSCENILESDKKVTEAEYNKDQGNVMVTVQIPASQSCESSEVNNNLGPSQRKIIIAKRKRKLPAARRKSNNTCGDATTTEASRTRKPPPLQKSLSFGDQTQISTEGLLKEIFPNVPERIPVQRSRCRRSNRTTTANHQASSHNKNKLAVDKGSDISQSKSVGKERQLPAIPGSPVNADKITSLQRSISENNMFYFPEPSNLDQLAKTFPLSSDSIFTFGQSEISKGSELREVIPSQSESEHDINQVMKNIDNIFKVCDEDDCDLDLNQNLEDDSFGDFGDSQSSNQMIDLVSCGPNQSPDIDMKSPVFRSSSDVSSSAVVDAHKKRHSRKERPYKSDPFHGNLVRKVPMDASLGNSRSFSSGRDDGFPDDCSLEEVDENSEVTRDETEAIRYRLSKGNSCSIVSDTSTDSGVIGHEGSQEVPASPSSGSSGCGSSLKESTQGGDLDDCSRAALSAKLRRERRAAILELRETEISYGRDLTIIKEQFYKPLSAAGLLNMEQIESVFLNLDELIRVNQEITQKLDSLITAAQESGDEELESASVANVFLDCKEWVHVFEHYCVNQGQAAVTLEALERDMELLRVFLQASQNENPVLRRMPLKAFLILPVQRITRYPLLLERLYRSTCSSNQEKATIKEAKAQIESILGHINAKTRNSGTLKVKKKGADQMMRQAAILESNELNKLAIEILGWNKKDVTRILTCTVQVASPSEQPWSSKKLKSIKYSTVHAVVVSLGQYTANNTQEEDSVLLFPRPTTVIQAAIVMIREKNSKYYLHQEPLFLNRCIVIDDPDCQSHFEITDNIKDTVVIKREINADQKLWLRTVKQLTFDLGSWRRRRNALPNIMIKHLI